MRPELGSGLRTFWGTLTRASASFRRLAKCIAIGVGPGPLTWDVCLGEMKDKQEPQGWGRPQLSVLLVSEMAGW
jgi:hypothetical protein